MAYFEPEQMAGHVVVASELVAELTEFVVEAQCALLKRLHVHK
jgi:hypothetical protein